MKQITHIQMLCKSALGASINPIDKREIFVYPSSFLIHASRTDDLGMRSTCIFF